MGNADDFIFLISDEGSLTRAPSTPYKNEDQLQRLVAKHWEVLLAGDPSGEAAPHWMLVDREVGIPDAEAAGDRWAIDHVFLDQHGIPTFVEVKRSSDTRIRREVVGQMLEYAANARRYWPVGRLRALAEEHASQDDKGTVANLLDLEPDNLDSERIDTYWQTVDENIRDGHIRLLFVADRLPRELKAIIEFLNEKMETVEVLGVELRQYTAQGVRALVPRIVGQTEATRVAKRRQSAGPPLTEDAFMEACPLLARGFFAQVLRDAPQHNMKVYWGTTSFSLRVPRGDGKFGSVLYGYLGDSYGHENPFVHVYFKWAGDDAGRQALRQRVLDLGGFRSAGDFTAELSLIDEAAIVLARRALEVVWEIAADRHAVYGMGEAPD